MWARSGSVPSLRVNTYYFMKYSLPDPAILLFADRNAAERLQHDFWQAFSRSAIGRLEPERWKWPMSRVDTEARTTERMFEEDQLLYEFFSHAYSLVDSFCFGAYFVGAQLSSSHFKPNPNLRSVNPLKLATISRSLTRTRHSQRR